MTLNILSDVVLSHPQCGYRVDEEHGLQCSKDPLLTLSARLRTFITLLLVSESLYQKIPLSVYEYGRLFSTFLALFLEEPLTISNLFTLELLVTSQLRA